ncbi:ATP-binding cassette domain-containing protein [Nocardia sp. NBC_01499]|uniref:ABC transporter ATP-binding protein n=1 Tax=Nocardia sp. NBC_01499 TaxID=2903597 RepID=UPI003866F787
MASRSDVEGARVEVRDLTKTFPDRRVKRAVIRALDSVSFDIEGAEIFGLLGPNGAGKSTLVRILATLSRPDSGTAAVAGYDIVRDGASVRRHIGVALQDTGIDPTQTGAALLELHARLYGLSRERAEHRVAELIDRFDLNEVATRRISGYSGGMRRRLDLAVALVHRPTVLLLDEPTTGLDLASRRRLWQEIRALRDEGTTILLTTQYLEEADKLADRVAIIDGGRVVREGSPAELKRSLRHDVIELTLDDEQTAERAAAALHAPFSPGMTQVRIGVDDAAVEVATVVTTLAAQNITPTAVNLTSPTLDDVFLNAIEGRNARIDESKVVR